MGLNLSNLRLELGINYDKGQSSQEPKPPKPQPIDVVSLSLLPVLGEIVLPHKELRTSADLINM